MYENHFGLHENPFGITPDTAFFFSHGNHLEALNTLLIAAKQGEGFIKVVGEVGTGKTLLCRQFLKMLGNDFVSAFVPNPYLEPRSLFLSLAHDLHLVLNQNDDEHAILHSINMRLVEIAANNQKVILCIDEAQALPLETLEAIRLLSNLETEKRKLIQIVLFGQPELNWRLKRPEIRQLAQRIGFHYVLRPLSLQETRSYLMHRLRVAGFQSLKLFSSSALRLLWLASAGVPRLINILANKSLLVAYGKGQSHIHFSHVYAAVMDTESHFLSQRMAHYAWLSVITLTLMIITMMIYLWLK